MGKMTKEEAGNCFNHGIDCSQVVFGHAAQYLDLDAAQAKKIAAAFGGGMWHGETCGCVAGALMAIGCKYGHCEMDDTDRKNEMLAKKAEFEARFTKECGSLICKEMLGADLSTEEGMAKIMEEQLLATKCPGFACLACDILDDILK